MLSIHTGHDTRYFTDAVAEGREGYYTDAVAAGEPPGRWYGTGAQALGLAGVVDAELLEAVYTERLDPRDPATHSRSRWGQAARLGRPPRRYRTPQQLYAELLTANPGAGPELREALRAQAERRAHQPVSFYDLTFSPSKTITTLWAGCAQAAQEARAAGDEAGAGFWAWAAGQVEEAVMDGARAGMDYAERQACYARTGHHGGGAGRWVRGRGLVVAQFLQHDTRNGDPQLHVHQGVQNIVQCPDGAYRAVDGQILHRARGAIAAVSERGCEASLHRRLGVPVATRADGKAREVVGADLALADGFSSRRHDTAAYAEQSVARFVAARGRQPDPRELDEIYRRATLATRAPKSHRSHTRGEQLARWDAHARTVSADGLAGEARSVLGRAARTPHTAQTWSVEDVIARALAGVAGKHAKWTRWQLFREISDALPGHLALATDQEMVALLDGLTDAALARAVRLTPPEPVQDLPPDMVDEDGRAVYAKPGEIYYATREQLAGEHALSDAAVAGAAAALGVEHADAVIAAYANAGCELGADQAAAVHGVLTSGASLEVLTAPAGTGKSFTIGVLEDAWSGEGRRVVGLAPSQAAAEVLADDGITAANIDYWQAALDRLDAGSTDPEDERLRLRRDDLLVVDEAGAASTGQLLNIQRRCAQAGAKLLLVGDPQQLGPVGPGGALADLTARARTYHLVEVRRFTEEWEGPASLRLRERDPAVLDEYHRRGRLLEGGTPEQAQRLAGRLWLADTLTGRDALLTVASNADAAAVSTWLREELVAHGRVNPDGVDLTGRGGVAGVGDLVQARRNDRALLGFQGNTSFPVNRKTYRVLATRPDGTLVVARVTGRDTHGGEQLAPPIVLPASYVAEHVALAYASTAHAAQGRTTDTAYPVIGPHTDLAGLYVPLTRGREGNWACVITRALPPDAETGQTLEVQPTTPRAVLAGILERAELDDTHGRPESASAYAARAAEQSASIMRPVDRLAAEVGEHTARRAATVLDQLTADGVLTHAQGIEIGVDEHYGSLVGRLRTAELAGHNLETVLTTAAKERDFTGARSVTDVLCGRISRALRGQPAPQLVDFTDLIPRQVPEQYRVLWEQRAAAADERRFQLGRRLADHPPRWAVEALGPVPTDPVGRAEWEQRAGWAAAYSELIGHPKDTNPLSAPPPMREAEKVAVWRTARAALHLPDADTANPAVDLSAGALRARYRAGERATDTAPRYVTDNELAAATQQIQDRRANATLWADRAQRATDPDQRDQHAAAAAQARQRAGEAEQAHRLLEEMAQARAAWFAHTAVTREHAAVAKAALNDLGIDVDDPAEQTTARDWLAEQAHAAQQAEEDAHRAITDETDYADIAEQRAADLAALDPEPVDTVETAPPDPDERLSRHPSEDCDPDQRRRVPTADELTADIARARAACRALADQQAADAARKADEEARRDELYRWADADQANDQPTADQDADLVTQC